MENPAPVGSMVTLRLTGTMRIALKTLTKGIIAGIGDAVLTVEVPPAQLQCRPSWVQPNHGAVPVRGPFKH